MVCLVKQAFQFDFSDFAESPPKFVLELERVLVS
jgi:hypothetical protein